MGNGERVLQKSTWGYSVMKLLLFDIDGTLLATNGAGSRAVRRAFERVHGVEITIEAIDFAGKTDPLILKEIYQNGLGREHTQEEAREVYKHYVHYLKEEITTAEVEVMPGVRELLNILSRRDDLALGVATGNIEEGAHIKLTQARLGTYFSFGGYGSDSEVREHLIRRAIERAHSYINHTGAFEETYVIGDTPFDINHGRAADSSGCYGKIHDREAPRARAGLPVRRSCRY
jgi:phosphoglycolate phosphatase